MGIVLETKNIGSNFHSSERMNGKNEKERTKRSVYTLCANTLNKNFASRKLYLSLESKGEKNREQKRERYRENVIKKKIAPNGCKGDTKVCAEKLHGAKAKKNWNIRKDFV